MDLYEAVFYGNVEACERLIKEGENINVEIGSITPIRLALLFDHKNVADLLIKNGADIKFGKNLFELISCQNYPVAKILIKNGFNMDEEDIYGRTILLHLLWCNDINMIKFLIKNGANINNIDKYGSSILHRVRNTSQGRELLVPLSLKYGADINAKDMNGQTPLHYAVCNSAIEMINLLIKNGANPCILDNDGNLPLHSLFKNSFQNYKTYLIFDILFPYCGDINAVNYAGDTFLHISDKSIKTIDFLLNKGANPNIINNKGETVLHKCSHLDITIMEFLLNRGANPNLIINGENTILYTITAPDNRDSYDNINKKIKLLLKYGANPNLIDKNNETLFIKIVRENCKARKFFDVDLLLPYVTDYDVVDTYGHSALYYFIKNEYHEQTRTILKLKKIKKKKTILLMLTAHEFDEGSLLHRDYLCRDLFKILVGFL